MEDNLNKRQLQGKKTSMEDNLNSKTISMEDNLKGIFTAKRIKSQEDNLTKRQS